LTTVRPTISKKRSRHSAIESPQLKRRAAARPRPETPARQLPAAKRSFSRTLIWSSIRRFSQNSAKRSRKIQTRLLLTPHLSGSEKFSKLGLSAPRNLK